MKLKAEAINNFSHEILIELYLTIHICIVSVNRIHRLIFNININMIINFFILNFLKNIVFIYKDCRKIKIKRHTKFFLNTI